MQKLPLSFLALSILAVFVAEFPRGDAADDVLTVDLGSSKNESTEIEAEGPGNSLLKKSSGVSSLRLYKRLRTWSDAQSTCYTDGGQLVVIDSAQKLAIVRSWLTTESLNAIWVGFHDLFQEGSWRTVTGQPVNELDYDPWANGQPNYQYNTENCGVVWRYQLTDGVDDTWCNGKYAFVCEDRQC
ncbi:hemolymph lipopolysaccharide-binding protein-like [Augochlora pura]